MNKLWLGVILCLVTGCRQEFQKVDQTSEGCTTIDIPVAEKFDMNKMVDSLMLIKLEVTDSSLFGHVNKVRIYKDHIYIHDRRYAKALFIFDKNGRHIKTVKHQGRGPGEFISIMDFELCHFQEEIMVMDNFGQKFGFFDLEGNYLREAPSKIEVMEAVSLPGGMIVHAKHENSFWKNGKPQSLDKIFYTDERGEILKTIFPYDDNANIPFGFGEALVDHPDSSYTYAPRFRDTIYNLTAEGLTPRYALHFDKSIKVSERILQKEDEKVIGRILKEGKYCFLGDHQESPSWLFLSLNYYSNLSSAFYAKKTGKVKTFKAYQDEMGWNAFIRPLYLTGEYFWTSLTYDELKNYGLDSLIDKLSLKMEDNPYLIRYRLKEF